MTKTPEIDAITAIQKAGDNLSLALRILHTQKDIAREEERERVFNRLDQLAISHEWKAEFLLVLKQALTDNNHE